MGDFVNWYMLVFSGRVYQAENIINNAAANNQAPDQPRTSIITVMDQNRRDFIKSASALAAASMLPNAAGFKGPICLFSKHLPAMDWARMAQAVKKLGFGGIAARAAAARASVGK